MIPIFLGYDTRETIAFHVCSNSIIRHATDMIAISPLSLHLLKKYKEIHVDGSNSFTYSRFLVPYIMNYKGWAIYLDGDMILRDDIKKLLELKDENYAVMVVKHNYKTSSKTKYLGIKNEDYPCKNWSSVILWNCEHPLNRILTPQFVENATGENLHRFTWLTETNIGELPIVWNWLPDEFGNNNDAKLLHFTLGTPCFPNFSHSAMADEWHLEKQYTEYFKSV